MSTNKRTLYIFAGAGIVLMFVFLALFVRSRNTVMLILGVIMLNAAFQLIARLLINSICEGAFENGINSSSDWFRTTDFEERFYGFMGIKYLKKHLPKTERTDFSLSRMSPQNIIDAGCEIEAEHEIDILVSLLGILLSIPFGNVWIFVTAAVIAILYDLIYLSVQRYNRPRLERIQLKRRARFFEKMEREEKMITEQTEPQEVSVIGGGEENQ
ncbi:MAG: hypothetical protein ACI4QY_04140 [Oscillospiraceae bacterium]